MSFEKMSGKARIEDYGRGWVNISCNERLYKVNYRVYESYDGIEVEITKCDPYLLQRFGKSALEEYLYLFEA